MWPKLERDREKEGPKLQGVRRRGPNLKGGDRGPQEEEERAKGKAETRRERKTKERGRN